MKYDTIIYEVKDSIAWITLNRPDVMNVFNETMVAEVQSLVEQIDKDDLVRVMVIIGNGRAFCTGADLKSVSKFIEGPHIKSGDFDKFSQSLNHLFNTIENLSKPVIAAINGYCLAGGLELMLACDLVVCSEKAKLGDQHTNVGLIGASGGTQRLPRIVGIRKAKELLLTGEMITAEDAKNLNLVNRVVPAEELEEAVAKLASEIAGKSPLVSSSVKRLVNMVTQVDLHTGIELERGAVVRHHQTQDMKEGISAFREKRKPNFVGK